MELLISCKQILNKYFKHILCCFKIILLFLFVYKLQWRLKVISGLQGILCSTAWKVVLAALSLPCWWNSCPSTMAPCPSWKFPCPQFRGGFYCCGRALHLHPEHPWSCLTVCLWWASRPNWCHIWWCHFMNLTSRTSVSVEPIISSIYLQHKMDTQDATVDGSFQVLMVWTNQLKNKQTKYTYNVKLCAINMP